MLLKDRAYQELKELLLSDEVPSGQFMSERSIAERLGMGLAPVRSAIARLKAERIVEDVPNKGLMVPQMSVSAIHDFYETRSVLESFVVRSLAQGLRPSDRQRLLDHIELQHGAVRARDPMLFRRYDYDFHLLLLRLHGNQELIMILENLRVRLDRFHNKTIGSRFEAIPFLVDQHAALADAIVTESPELAEKILQEHLDWGRKAMLSREIHLDHTI